MAEVVGEGPLPLLLLESADLWVSGLEQEEVVVHHHDLESHRKSFDCGDVEAAVAVAMEVAEVVPKTNRVAVLFRESPRVLHAILYLFRNCHGLVRMGVESS